MNEQPDISGLVVERYGLSLTLQKIIRRNNRKYVRALAGWFCAPISIESPSAWVERNIILHTPFSNKVPFTLAGREYLRDQIDDIDDPNVIQQTTCAGTGSGKTTRDLAQMLWACKNDPFPGLYIMPSLKGPGGAVGFNNHCIITTIEASPVFSGDVPRGAKRHDFSGQRISFIGNDIDFAGSNSAVQLGNKRCRIVWLGEQDKYKPHLGREASPDYLAGERTKAMSGVKIIRGSTPTHEDSGIWPHLIGSGNSTGSDCRRRCLPCPHCNSDLMSADRMFVLVKDEQYNVALPSKTAHGKPLSFAELRWDKEARRADGSWDLSRVIRSARFECPHCGGHFRDEHRVWADKNGVWMPTRPGEHGHRGYHLPSFYTAMTTDRDGHVEHASTFGGMAEKFLRAMESGGIGGFINSDLAEVHVSQEHGRINIESSATNFATEEWIPLMTVDFQKLWPYLWFVVQKWSCFKLHAPFGLVNGRPNVAGQLSAELAAKCQTIVGGHEPAWVPIAEILRFDPRTGEFPMLDFLISKKIVADSLVGLWRDHCAMNTLDLGRWIYREMGLRMPKGGDSEIIAAGHCELSGDDAWQELRELGQQYNVGVALKKFNISEQRAVMIDSGYAESHNPEVLRKCFESGSRGRWEWYDPMAKQFSRFKRHNFCHPTPVDCWLPFKGYPIRRRWRVGGIERELHIAPDDPFKGLAEAGKYTIGVLEAASELYFHRWMESRSRQKAIRQSLAEGMAYRGNIWNISQDCKFHGPQCRSVEDFNRQLNAKVLDKDGKIIERGSGGAGKRRHPDHLNDCCRNQYPLAEVLGFFSYEQAKAK